MNRLTYRCHPWILRHPLSCSPDFICICVTNAATAMPHRTTLFKKEANGEKCTSSPKHPHDSMLPNMVGMNRFTPVRHTNNESITKATHEAVSVNLLCRKSMAVSSSTEQITIAASSLYGTKPVGIYASMYSIVSKANECIFTALSNADVISTADSIHGSILFFIAIFVLFIITTKSGSLSHT